MLWGASPVATTKVKYSAAEERIIGGAGFYFITNFLNSEILPLNTFKSTFVFIPSIIALL
jgi:hypothetical protein